MKTIKHFLPALLAACLLCSCAKAPEKPEGSELLSPTAEVIKNARAEIEEIRGIDGIFKLDSARLLLPEADEMPVYDARMSIADTAGHAKKAFEAAEKFGITDLENYGFFIRTYNHVVEYDEENGGYPTEVSFDIEYLNTDEYIAGDEFHPFLNVDVSAPVCFEFYIGGTLYETAEYKKLAREFDIKNGRMIDMINSVKAAKEVIDLVNADERTLSRTIPLVHGEATVGELIKRIGELDEKLLYDEKLRVKPVLLYLFESEEGKYIACADCRVTCGGINISDSSPFHWSGKAFGIENPYTMAPSCAAIFIRPEEPDRFFASMTSVDFIRRGDEKYENIVSAKKLFELLKEKLSNSAVYDVREVSLGYLPMREYPDYLYYDNKPETYNALEVMPVWQVRFCTSSTTYIATVHALTGEINLRAANTNELFP